MGAAGDEISVLYGEIESATQTMTGICNQIEAQSAKMVADAKAVAPTWIAESNVSYDATNTTIKNIAEGLKDTILRWRQVLDEAVSTTRSTDTAAASAFGM